MLAYHFTGETLSDGRPLPAIGEWLVHEGPIIPCESGLHGSVHPYDALQYRLGHMLHHVEIDGEIVEHGGDKIAGRRRRILATIDATQLLSEFARRRAAGVLHLFDAPDVVRTYLTTGRDDLMDAADRASTAAYLKPRYLTDEELLALSGKDDAARKNERAAWCAAISALYACRKPAWQWATMATECAARALAEEFRNTAPPSLNNRQSIVHAHYESVIADARAEFARLVDAAFAAAQMPSGAGDSVVGADHLTVVDI